MVVRTEHRRPPHLPVLVRETSRDDLAQPGRVGRRIGEDLTQHLAPHRDGHEQPEDGITIGMRAAPFLHALGSGGERGHPDAADRELRRAARALVA